MRQKAHTAWDAYDRQTEERRDAAVIRSMTGYGRGVARTGMHDVTVEIRSVNHRFFEFSARVPRGYGYLEEKLKKQIGTQVSRGKVEVNVAISAAEGGGAQVELNEELVRGYVQALRSLCVPFMLEDDLSLSAVARLPEVFSVRRSEEDEEAVWQEVLPAVEEALRRFFDMREREGARLEADMREKLETLERHVAFVEERSPETVRLYRERLYQKMTELLENRAVDEQRILLEAGLYADRVAVDEETVRLRSHLEQFKQFLASPEAVGRRLDFLVQEINRETNTIGSKAQDAPTAGVVVEMKSEIEKIREQIQNIE